jgi:hypothetical protein
MRQTSCALLTILILLPSNAAAQERLSKSWCTNSQTNKVHYFTTDVMPKGAELRIRVAEAGRADILIYNYHDGGASPQVQRFRGVSAGQVLTFKLPSAMRVGIGVGTPAQAACVGAEDKETYHILKYDFGNLGKFSLDSKVVGEQF